MKWKYYQIEPKFNDVYSRSNLSKIKNGAHIINLDEYESIGTHWIVLFVSKLNIFRKKVENSLEIKILWQIFCRMQAYGLIMCGYFCIGCIDFMLKGKTLLDFTNLFSPNDDKKNNKILKYFFQWLKSWKNYIVLFVVSRKNLKTLKDNISSKNISPFYYLQ